MVKVPLVESSILKYSLAFKELQVEKGTTTDESFNTGGGKGDRSF